MTTKLSPLFYLPLWEQAYEQEFGLLVKCPTQEDQRALVQALYSCRQIARRPEFDKLMIFQVNPPGTTYIAHKSVELT